MKKNSLLKAVVITVGLYTFFVMSMISTNGYYGSLLAAEGSGTSSCDCELEGGGNVGPGCTDFWFQDGELLFACCSSEGAFPSEYCNCSIECNTPYSPEECIVPNPY